MAPQQPRRSSQTPAFRAWRWKKHLHLYKLALGIKGKVRIYWANETSRQENCKWYRILNRSSFSFWLPFLCPLKSSTFKILVDWFLLPVHWCHQQPGTTTKKPAEMSKCFQTWFKGNLHRVSWFAWQEQRCRPINHSQVWHSYLALPYQLSQGEQKLSSQTFQSDTSWRRLEAKFWINSMTDLIFWHWANQFTERIISITTPPR